MKLSSHQTRIITAVILLAALIGAIVAGGNYMRLLLALASCLAVHEFLSMYWPGRFTGRKIACMALGVLIILSQAVDPLLTIAVLLFAFCGIGLAFLFDFGGFGAPGKSNPGASLEQYCPLVTALLYIPLIMQMALYLRPAEQGLIMLAAIASDTGGYYAGSRYGKRKLWPEVSPKKTWAGLFGGLALCAAACTAYTALALELEWYMPPLPLWGWALAAVLLNQAAVFGDLFESALKRSLSIKDSGSILPGHGGMLDRIDSTLFVLAAYMILRLAVRLAKGA